MLRASRLAALVAAAGLLLAAPATARAQVGGRVIDAASGAPIAEAEAGYEGVPSSRVLTDRHGAFRLPAPAGAPLPLILVRRLGYAAARVAIADSTAELLVRLTPHPVALEAIVVTAARREQRLADVVVTTELIGRDEIERSGAADLAGVLGRHTGIQAEGGVPSGAGVMLQGLGAQRVLVLLDGQPVTGRVNGNLDLSRLPVSMVERIEVVKGPQSTLYGSDAMGGVINIVTRRPGGPGAGVHAATTAGSHGRREVSAGSTGRVAALGWTVDAGYRTTDLAPGVAGEAGTFARRAHAAPRLEWRVSRNWTLETAAMLLGERQRYRTGQLYNFSDNVQLNGRIAAAYRTSALSFAPVVSWSRFDHLSRRSTGPEPASDSGAVDLQDLAQVELPVSFSAGGTTLDAGLLLRRDAIRAERVPGGARALHSAEPWAQATLAAGQFSVTPGARVSASERWGTVLTPRIAALWRPRPAIAVRGAIGRGYRAPDFKELYLDFANPAAGYAVRGNPDLRPETSTNASLAIEWVAPRWTARATAFGNRYRNFIETTEQDASGTFSYGNIARGSTRGLEVETGLALGALQVDAAWAWLVARDDSARGGGPLLGRPRHSLRLGASASRGIVRGGGTLQVTGTTPLARDSSGTVSRERRGFVRLDLRAAVAVFRGLELSAGADNVLDSTMGADWPGFTGRQLYVGMRWEAARR